MTIIYKYSSMDDSIIKQNTDDPQYLVFIARDPDNSVYREYLKWVEDGGITQPPDIPQNSEPLTPQQKLEAAGLTVNELKTLLGLK